MQAQTTTISPLTLTTCPTCNRYPECAGMDRTCPVWHTWPASAPLTRELARLDMHAVGVTV